MARRKKMSKRSSKRSFSKNAVRVNPRNAWNVMRGGIRL